MYASESWVQNLYALSVNEDSKSLEKSWEIFVFNLIYAALVCLCHWL